MILSDKQYLPDIFSSPYSCIKENPIRNPIRITIAVLTDGLHQLMFIWIGL